MVGMLERRVGVNVGIAGGALVSGSRLDDIVEDTMGEAIVALR